MAVHKPNTGDERQRIEQAISWLARGGPLARCMSDFEVRPQQEEMARAVACVLADGGVGLLEAGTGTGKSLAYLVPAVAAALVKRARIVVSTNTLNLQEQLLRKDVPLAQAALAEEAPFKAAALKGWSNYVCLLRLDQSLTGQATLFPHEHNVALQLRQWATDDSHFGSRDEAPFPVPDDVWDEVHAESDTCVRNSCPFYERCYFFRARRRAQEADIVIANHHLVCADVAVRQQLGWDTDISVLPGYDHVIFDEAHHLEDIVTEHFGLSFSRLRLRRLLQRIAGPRGLAAKLRRLVTQYPDGRDVEVVADLLIGDLPEAVASAQQAADGLFAYVANAARDAIASATSNERQSEASTVELAPGQLEPVGWRPAAEGLERVATVTKRLAESVRAWRPSDPAADVLVREAEALTRRAVGAASDLVDLAEAADGRFVYWMERRGRRHDEFVLRGAPVEVGSVVQDALLSHVKACVFTSATLSAGDDFDYFKQRLGLDGWPAVSVQRQIASPFDYRHQVLLGLPDDLPPPDDRAFPSKLAEALTLWLQASGGRAFVLFTSYRALDAAHTTIVNPLSRLGMTVLKQGDDARPRLLERFRRAERPVLFGTDSFWEGVDVPGAALSLVVIARLPFRVPTDPVEKARGEAIEQRGGDPFTDYSLPRAIMRVRQGFGRLIRSKSDRGAVIIADTRVHGRAYGRRFLTALPPTEKMLASSSSVAAAISDWLG